MLLSQSCMYGIRAALLASIKGENNKEVYIPIRQISDELGVSFHFLTKILQILTQSKLMESYKGPNGGVRLARPADEIYLINIVEALDGNEVFSTCLLGLPGCSEETPCPLHEQWGKSKDELEAMFKETSLAFLANDSNRSLFRF